MNNDQRLLAEAYESVRNEDRLDEAKKLSGAQKKLAAAAPPPDEITGADFKALKGKKGKKLEEAYEEILESKHINKKFARRYTKVVGSMLKAEPGSKEYNALKDEKEDLVKILADHGMTPTDLDQYLAKKEVVDSTPAPEETAVEESANGCTQCGGDHNISSCPEDGHVAL